MHWFCTQADSGGKVKIFGGDNISHREKKVTIKTYVILNGYRDKAV